MFNFFFAFDIFPRKRDTSLPIRRGDRKIIGSEKTWAFRDSLRGRNMGESLTCKKGEFLTLGRSTTGGGYTYGLGATFGFGATRAGIAGNRYEGGGFLATGVGAT